MRAFARAFGDHRWKRVVGVTAAQSGKTATVLDIIGERLDNRPAPILYVGPNKEFLTDQLEPRIEEMFRQAESLGAKVIGGIESKEQGICMNVMLVGKPQVERQKLKHLPNIFYVLPQRE